MATSAAKSKQTRMDIFNVIGFLLIFCFGYVVPPFGGITELGMRMMGILIGLIFMTCVGCNIITSALMALVAMVFHGYYDAATMISTWVGSTTTFQLVFCGALCLAMRQSGAMDVLAKKMLTSKICQGRPMVLLFMIYLAGFCVSIFVAGAPFFLLFFGLMDSILSIAGYDKKDPFYPLAILGVYVSAYGSFFLPWRGAMAVTVAMFNSVLNPMGFVFNDWVYMLTQVVTFPGFYIIYVLMLKYIFRVDMSKLKSVDVNKVESLQKVPDKFDFFMKLGLGSLAFCVLYILVTNLLPTTTPGYAYWGSFGMSLIWVLPLIFFSIVRKDGKPIWNVAKLAQDSSMWTMIALVGSLTMLGKITTDEALGIRGWLVGIFTPLFGDMPIWLLMLIVTVFAVVVTQIVNGQVLTMGLTPIIGPIVCTMILEQGVVGSPTVMLSVLSAAAQVAYLTVSGSVNAAYLLNRDDINSKFIFTKGVVVLVAYTIWQYIVGIVLNYLLPGV